MKLTRLAILLPFLVHSASAEHLRNGVASDSSSSDDTRLLQADDPKEDMVAKCRNARCDDTGIPHTGYVRVLHAGEWLRPNQYLAEFDATGTPVFTFGLTANGTFGLYDEDGLMVWGPTDDDGEPVQCDKLKFQQGNGHLTCYNSYNNKDGSYRIEHMWKSKCKDDQYQLGGAKIVRKLTLADGDVNQLDNNGAVVWTLQGSKIYTNPQAVIEPVCRPKLVSKYSK